MNLWQRASGALKDRKALLTASLSRRTSYRIPDLESAIIKATNHNEKHVDYRNAQRVFAWIRASPVSLKPLMWALSIRMDKTQNWVVALKGLMLMHGVFCCKTPAVLRIKKLPFDLSNFTHHAPSLNSSIWGFNAFIRSYYTYLDRRWSFLYSQILQSESELGLAQHLIRLENLQSLLAILLQIKPAGDFMKVSLILEAMDCVVIEIFDVHSRICNVIANVLIGIYSAKNVESLMAIKLLHKALIQAEELAQYFQFCKEFGVFNAMEIPQLQKIPEDEIRDLERMLNNGVSETKSSNGDENEKKKKKNVKEKIATMKTVITEKWEVFEEDNRNDDYELVKIDQDICHFRTSSNPFETSSNYLPLVPVSVYKHEHEQDQIPDFITFY
ncbi:putative clathrin assembly protein At1g25240 [Euphorbia lathyris]|uniref:putative clathrin assembly protein At1g25240 n=1 Tax=Euphorbia lathyris TaxID=212925 RepID=UPI003313504E